CRSSPPSTVGTLWSRCAANAITGASLPMRARLTPRSGARWSRKRPIIGRSGAASSPAMRSRTGYRRKSRSSARWHRTRRRSLAVTPATIPELLYARVRATPNAEAYRQYDSERGVWVSYSWGEIEERIGRWRDALEEEGLPSGARIALLIPNGIEHVCMDQAALSLGFVPVPMHVIDQPESLVYVLGDSGASLLLVDSADRWRTLEPFASSLPSLKRVVYLAESVPPPPAGIACALAQWLGATQPSARRSEIAPSVDPDALAAIVYTSGTTRRPKGVMLSHRKD